MFCVYDMTFEYLFKENEGESEIFKGITIFMSFKEFTEIDFSLKSRNALSIVKLYMLPDLRAAIYF